MLHYRPFRELFWGRGCNDANSSRFSAARPLAVRAQQPTMPVIGYLSATSAEPTAHLLAAFRKGFSEAGYVEDRNLAAL
jgi:hypothetical protein